MKTKNTTVYTVLDLEMNQPSNTIIQIGAVIIDISTNQVLWSGSYTVKTDEWLNPQISLLTGIDQEDLEEGMPLLDAYAALRQAHIDHGAFINPVVWGGEDLPLLYKQLPEEAHKCFGRRWIDVKTLYSAYRIANGKRAKGGLSTALSSIGMKFEGRPHNAAADALNTARLFVKMLTKLKREDANEEE